MTQNILANQEVTHQQIQNQEEAKGDSSARKPPKVPALNLKPNLHGETGS